jgi:tetratricopeptide (TPR) repeat protein
MAVIPLIEALHDEDASVRLATAWALGEIKDRDSIRPLIRTLENDDDQLVREMAALALGEIEDRKAIRPLMDAFDREKTLRTAVIWALGEIRGEEAEVARRVAFGKWGRKPYDNQQVWVGDYVGYDLDDLSLSPEVLMARLRSGTSEERISAAGSFGILGVIDGIDDVEPAVDALLDALRDEVPEVRALAVWSLDEINPSRSMRRSGIKAIEKSLTEYRMNALGYLYLQVNKPDEAVEIFKANVELHPDSWNCYDSLGEAYMMAGEVDRAIANYERSLDLNPHNENGREKLRALRELR